jgi:hypothetical protein
MMRFRDVTYTEWKTLIAFLIYTKAQRNRKKEKAAYTSSPNHDVERRERRKTEKHPR